MLFLLLLLKLHYINFIIYFSTVFMHLNCNLYRCFMPLLFPQSIFFNGNPVSFVCVCACVVCVCVCLCVYVSVSRDIDMRICFENMNTLVTLYVSLYLLINTSLVIFWLLWNILVLIFSLICHILHLNTFTMYY